MEADQGEIQVKKKEKFPQREKEESVEPLASQNCGCFNAGDLQEKIGEPFVQDAIRSLALSREFI